MTHTYKRGELAETCCTWIVFGFWFSIITPVGISMVTSSDQYAAGFGVLMCFIAFCLAIGWLNNFYTWITGLTQRIDDTAINTAKTNETLVLILNELKLMHEVETKHKQHFDEYADWMSDTMNTVNSNIIKT